MSDIQSKVIAIISDKLGVEKGEISLDSNFISDLGADSLDTVELIMELEKDFNIEIPDSEAEAITTVAEAISNIESKL